MEPIGEPISVAQRFRLRRLLGRGSLGATHVVEDAEAPGAFRALRLVPRGSLPGNVVAELRRAALVQRRIRHPGLARCLDFGFDPDSRCHWLLAELADGPDLVEAAVHLPVAALVPLVRQVLDALGHLRIHGIAHGSIRPSSIRIVSGPPGGRAVVIGGGLPEVDDPEGGQSPWYRAPEVLAGGVPTPLSDLYSVGVTLYQALTGTLPYAVLASVMGREGAGPASPEERDPLSVLLGPFAALIRRLLDRDPAARAASLPALLDAIAAETGVEDVPSGIAVVESLAPAGRLAGRETEMQVLRGLLGAPERRSRWRVLEGDAGLGKTRLLAEFALLCEVRGVRVLRLNPTFCDPGPAGLLRTIVAGLRRMDADAVDRALVRHGELRRVAEDAGRSASRRAEPPVPARQGQLRLFHQMAELVRGILREERLVILIDDVHAADALSLRALAFLLRETCSGGLAAVLSTDPGARPGGEAGEALRDLVEGSGALKMRIEPLGRDAVREFVTSVLGSGAEAERLSVRIHARTQGHPGHVEALLRSLREGDLRGLRGDGVPAGAEAVALSLGGRAQALEGPATRVLRALTAVGHGVPVRAMPNFLGLSSATLAQALDRLDLLGFLVGDPVSGGGRRVAVHPVALAMLEGSLEPAERSRWHGALAAVSGAAEIGAFEEALHTAEGDGPPEMRLAAFLTAAELARDRHDPDAERRLAGRALDLGLEIGDRAGVFAAARLVSEGCRALCDAEGALRALWRAGGREGPISGPPMPPELFREHALALSMLGRGAEAEDSFAHAVALATAAGDRAGAGASLLGLVGLLFRRGSFDEAGRAAAEALRVIGDGGPAEIRAGIESTLGLMAWYRCDWDAALRHHRCALGAKARQRDRGGIAACRINIGLVHWNRGDLREALRHFERAAAAATRTGDFLVLTAALNNVGAVRLESGHLDEAREILLRALRMRSRLGDRAGALKVLSNLALIELQRGAWGRARELLASAREKHARQGDGEGEASCLIHEAWVSALMGDSAAAVAGTLRGIRAASGARARAVVAEGLALLAEIRAGENRPVESARCAAAARRILECAGTTVDLAVVDLADALRLFHGERPEEARAVTARALRRLRRARTAWPLCRGLLLAGRFAPEGRGIATLRRALRLALRSGFRDLAWQSRYHLAERQLAAGERRQALEEAREAMAGIREIHGDMNSEERRTWLATPEPQAARDLLRRLLREERPDLAGAVREIA